MRNLFPVIPHYWIERRSIILPTEVLVGSSLHWMAILSSPLHGEDFLTMLFIIKKC